jgi:large subunit ribosomal protein L6
MSRVAKAPVVHGANVEITLAEGTITVKGPKGTLTQKN